MENEKINPFKVMVNPRGFIRKALSKTNRAAVVFAWLLGMTYLFGKAYTFGLGNSYELGSIFIFCIVFAIPVGYILLYVTAFFLFWVGKLFNGVASFEDVFAAYTWTRVPEAFIILIWLGLIGFFGKFTFTAMVVTQAPLPLFVIGLIGLQMIFAVWEAVILFHTLGEVQKLSAWITVWNVLFTWIILFFVDLIVNWFLIRGFDWRPIANLLIL